MEDWMRRQIIKTPDPPHHPPFFLVAVLWGWRKSPQARNKKNDACRLSLPLCHPPLWATVGPRRRVLFSHETALSLVTFPRHLPRFDACFFFSFFVSFSINDNRDT